jgi:iron(III) transport system ATP-binding protein
MKDVLLTGVRKTYEGTHQRSDVAAVQGVDLSVGAGDFFVLLGASGSGKTTLLRCIAGLESISGGEIRIGSATVAAANRFVPAQKRNIGMVFQDYAIWPHMTVGQNVEFALRHARSGALRGDAAKRRVMEVLEVVGLAELVDRGATYLSGGQQQRVALARAIVASPDVLLLDEPLSNLDAQLRALMRKELRRITSDLGITAIYVTHDQSEALAMADQVAVMRDGRVIQVGSPEQIYRRPADLFVGQFVGEANLIPGTVSGSTKTGQDDLVVVDTALGQLTVAGLPEMRAGDAVTVLIRPENLHLRRGDGRSGSTASPNAVSGHVTEASFAGAHTELTVESHGIALHAQVHAFEPVEVGGEVALTFDARWATALRSRAAGDGSD